MHLWATWLIQENREFCAGSWWQRRCPVSPFPPAAHSLCLAARTEPTSFAAVWAITAKGARWGKGWVGGPGPPRLAEAETKRCSAASLQWCSHWSGARLISLKYLFCPILGSKEYVSAQHSGSARLLQSQLGSVEGRACPWVTGTCPGASFSLSTSPGNTRSQKAPLSASHPRLATRRDEGGLNSV